MMGIDKSFSPRLALQYCVFKGVPPQDIEST